MPMPKDDYVHAPSEEKLIFIIEDEALKECPQPSEATDKDELTR
jgi:hypothetical protein